MRKRPVPEVKETRSGGKEARSGGEGDPDGSLPRFISLHNRSTSRAWRAFSFGDPHTVLCIFCLQRITTQWMLPSV
jgi:hypothetical protein